MASDRIGLHVVPTHQDLRQRIEAKLDRLIVPPTPALTPAQVSDLCITIMGLNRAASERPGERLGFVPGGHALRYWATLHFIEEISWMTYTMHQVTLEVRRQGINDTPAQFKAFDVASDAFVCWDHHDWPPADLVPWEPPAEALYPPFWAEPSHGQPHTIALHLLPMVPTHAELRSRVRRKIEGWAPTTAAPMPEHTLNQVCLTIGMLGSEKSEQRLIQRAASAHQFTGQQALLSWCAEMCLEEIDLLSHARLQVEFEARQRGITDEKTLRTLHNTALQEFMGTEAQWRQGYKAEAIG